MKPQNPLENSRISPRPNETSGKKRSSVAKSVIRRSASPSRSSSSSSDSDTTSDVDSGSCISDSPQDSEHHSDHESTLIIGSLEYYIDDLNTDGSLRPPPLQAESQLDTALLAAHQVPEKAKELGLKFMQELLLAKGHLAPEMPASSKAKKKKNLKNKNGDLAPPDRPLSKRKKRRQDYAMMQKLYSKNKHAVYQRIFQNNSLSPNLQKEDVFGYWKNLLTHSTLASGSLEDNYPIPYEQRKEKFT